MEYHIPVLLKEAIEALNVKKGGKYIDGTLGGGGHAFEILKSGGVVLGIDCDQEAIDFVEKSLKFKVENSTLNQNKFGSGLPRTDFQSGAGAKFKISKPKLILRQGNFADIKKIAEETGFTKVDGILFDLGVSTWQLEQADRGFSFNTESILDMRMDKNLTVTAKDLINGLREGELYELFTQYGEEHFARPIARAICRARGLKPIETCNDLAEIVLRARGGRGLRGFRDRTHPATRVFQALRIAVNSELESLQQVLPQAIDLLKNNGRLVVISFHSLEDRIVKNFLREQEEKGIVKILTKKPIMPIEEEIKNNSRSRNGKMRAATKI